MFCVVVRFRHVAGLRSRTASGQAGFTIAELLVALLIGGLVVASAALVLNLTMGQEERSSGSIAGSNSAFRTGSRFADDVASVGPVAGVTDLVAVGVTGCASSAAVLRLVGPSPTGDVLVRSYDRVTTDGTTKLLRRECTGATLAAATSAAAKNSTVVTDLDPDAGSVAVACDGGAAVSSSCRVVQMDVRTRQGDQFSVRGTIGAALTPTATTTPVAIQAPESGTCTIPASATTWGATGGAAGGNGTNHNNDPTVYTYDDTNQRRSFLKFDLTQPCADVSPAWPTLPGGRNITNVVLHVAYMGKTSDSCWIFPGISYDGQVLEPLNDASIWSESTLTGANMPGGVRSGFSYNFNVASPGSLSAHTNTAITDAVKHWYASNDWVNNGWRLSRSSAGDTCGKSNKFASRFESNTALRPKLVISWGP